MIKFIVYVSEAVSPPSAVELGNLLESSRKRNTADGVTGLLVYRFDPAVGRGHFLQVIEGQESAIEDLWGRISKDGRHYSIIVLEEGSESARMFEDWSMGFRNIDTTQLAAYPGLADLGSRAFWERAERGTIPEARELLVDFYNSSSMEGAG
ncbi:BLUF domain-containing protein [Amaricoccus macauensis]|uniref:BLUF domain-containing protein n=1 Tax=Amaricoccus macauensis TaxID=57001 RepID=UPI003C7B8304